MPTREDKTARIDTLRMRIVEIKDRDAFTSNLPEPDRELNTSPPVPEREKPVVVVPPRAAGTGYYLPTEGRLWILVSGALAVVGWYKNVNLLLLLAYVMIGLAILNGWQARRCVRRVRASRRPPGLPFAHEAVPIAAELLNSAERSATVEVRSVNATHSVRWFAPDLRPGEARRLTTDWRYPDRGRFVLPPLVVTSGYPFGLIGYRSESGPGGEVVVLPAVGEVDLGRLRRWLIRTGAGDAKTRRPVRRAGTHHADVRGVRGYRAGDSPRDVHWRTTARRNELMVREYDSTEPLDLILVLDPTPSPAFDWAVTVAASIAWAWANADETADVTLVAAGAHTPVRTVRGTPGFVRELLVPLADVRPAAHAAVPAGAGLRGSNRCARIVVGGGSPGGLASTLRSRFGIPFVPVGPSDNPAWFTPPVLRG
ncbi:MAG TPA: DUF58 domain-containing protein [Fimbriiglobus sp.]